MLPARLLARQPQIKLGLEHELRLGDLDARRDWGYAGDYVHAMWLMLQQQPAQDYVIGTGVTHSVRDFCREAFAHLDLDYQDYVVQDDKFIRPTEDAQLVADPTRARQVLGWEPRVAFSEIVKMMVESDLSLLKDGLSK